MGVQALRDGHPLRAQPVGEDAWRRRRDADDSKPVLTATNVPLPHRRPLTCVGVQGVGVLDRLFLLRSDLHSQRAGDVRSVASASLPVVHSAHVHGVAVHLPSQEPVGQRREEAAVGGQGVGGEDVRVRVRGHGENG